MDEEVLQQIFDELISSLEPLETHNAALLQFLKAKGLASDEELAPFIKQAANTSSVRWLGVRVRIDSLLSNAMKSRENETENSEPADNSAQSQIETKTSSEDGQDRDSSRDQTNSSKAVASSKQNKESDVPVFEEGQERDNQESNKESFNTHAANKKDAA